MEIVIWKIYLWMSYQGGCSQCVSQLLGLLLYYPWWQSRKKAFASHRVITFIFHVALVRLCYNPAAVTAVLSISQLPQNGWSVISSKTHSAGWGSCGEPIRSLSKFSTGHPFAWNTTHEKLSLSIWVQQRKKKNPLIDSAACIHMKDFKVGNRFKPRLFYWSLKSCIYFCLSQK